MADEAISYPLFPRDLREDLVVNGLYPQAAHGYRIEAAIRCLAAWGHQYPGFAVAVQESQAEVPVNDEYVTLIRLRPYVRALEVWFLIDAADGDNVKFRFEYDSLDFSPWQYMIGRGRIGADFDQGNLQWIRTTIQGIGDGANSGKADAGTIQPRKFAVVNDSTSDGPLYLYNLKFRARHNQMMNLQ